MSDISIKLSADEARAVQGFLGLVNAQQKVAESLEKISTAGQKVDREQQRWQREAQRAVQQSATAWERQTRVVAELGLALQRDEIDQKKFNAAVEQSARSLGIETEASRKLAAEQKASEEITRQKAAADKQAADAQRQWASESKRLLDGMRGPQELHNEKERQLKRLLDEKKISQQQYNQEVFKSKQAIDQVPASMGRVDSAGVNAFGAAALARVAAFGAAFLSVNKVLGIVREAMNDMDADRAAAGQREAAAAAPEGQLKQLAIVNGQYSDERYQQLLTESRKTFEEGGAKDRDAAARLQFQLESAGAGDQRAIFSGLAAKGVVLEPAVLAKSIKTVMTSMGEEETGNFRAMLSKGFAASQFAPTTAEQLMESSSRAGASAKALGVSDEEVLAANAIMARATGTAERGGTTVAALFKTLDEARRKPEDMPVLTDAEKRSLESARKKRELGDLTANETAAVEKERVGQGELSKRERAALKSARHKTLDDSELAAEEKQRQIAEMPAPIEFKGNVEQMMAQLGELEKQDPKRFGTMMQREEAMVAYRAMRDNMAGPQGFTAVTGAIRAGQERDLAGQIMASPDTAAQAAFRFKNVETAKGEVDAQNLGVKRNLADALAANMLQTMKEQGKSHAERWAWQQFEEQHRKVVGDEEWIGWMREKMTTPSPLRDKIDEISLKASTEEMGRVTNHGANLQWHPLAAPGPGTPLAAPLQPALRTAGTDGAALGVPGPAVPPAAGIDPRVTERQLQAADKQILAANKQIEAAKQTAAAAEKLAQGTRSGPLLGNADPRRGDK
ncbi:MAG: phage tail tape measure protein [Acidobacteria bacterium]|nr:phage tail tape measure protein [Acidobacteriota bacterium]